MISDADKNLISGSLEVLIRNFNIEFARWQENTGCRANFGWDYGDKDLPKKLVIKDIDAMIYVKPEPEWLKNQGELSSSKEGKS